MKAGFGTPDSFWTGLALVLWGALLVVSVLLVIAGIVQMKNGLQAARTAHKRSVPSGDALGYDVWKDFGLLFFLMQSDVLVVNFSISWGWMTGWLAVYLVLLLALSLLGVQAVFFGAFRAAGVDIHYPLFVYAGVFGVLLPLSFLLALAGSSSLGAVMWSTVCILNVASAVLFLVSLPLVVTDRFLLASLQSSCAVGLAGSQLVLGRLFTVSLPARLALVGALSVFFTIVFLFVFLRPYARTLVRDNRVLVKRTGRQALGLQLRAVLFFLVLFGLLLAFLWHETGRFSQLGVFFATGSASTVARAVSSGLAAVMLLVTSSEALGNLALALLNVVHIFRRRWTLRKLAAAFGAQPRDLVADEEGRIIAAGEKLVDRIIREGSLEAALQLSTIAPRLDLRLNMFIVNTLLQKGDHSAAAARHYTVNVEQFFMGCIETASAARAGVVKGLVTSLFLRDGPPPKVELDRDGLFAFFSKLAKHRDLLLDGYSGVIASFFQQSWIDPETHQRFANDFCHTFSLARNGLLPSSLGDYRRQCIEKRDWNTLREAYLVGPYDLPSCISLLRNCPGDPNADLYRLDLYGNSLLPCFAFPETSDVVQLTRNLFRGVLPPGQVTVKQAPFISFLKELVALPVAQDNPLTAALAGILSSVEFNQIQSLYFDSHNTLASAVALTRIMRGAPAHGEMVRRHLQDPLVMATDTTTTEEGCPVTALFYRAFCLFDREEEKKETDDEERSAGTAAT